MKHGGRLDAALAYGPTYVRDTTLADQRKLRLQAAVFVARYGNMPYAEWSEMDLVEALDFFEQVAAMKKLEREESPL